MPLKLAEFLFPAAVEVKTKTYYFITHDYSGSERRSFSLKFSLLKKPTPIH